MVETSVIPPRSPRPAGRASRPRGLVSLAALLVVLAAVGVLWGQWRERGVQRYPQSRWQAVFLDNGQVYFGHVRNVTGQSVVLTDIYYLQTAGPQLQPSGGTEDQPKLNLIKLGNEVHGPDDRMVITRGHVLLVENLRDDSKVVELIDRYRQDRAAGRLAPPAAGR